MISYVILIAFFWISIFKLQIYALCMTPLYKVYFKSISLVLLCELLLDLSVGPSLWYFLLNSSLIFHKIWYIITVTSSSYTLFYVCSLFIVFHKQELKPLLF